MQVEQVEVALKAAGIPHGQMRLIQESNNISFSDSNIFVKTTRSGFSSEQLQTELSLALLYGPTHMFTPVYPTLIEVGKSSMSVWKYEALTQLHPKTVSPEIAGELAERLNTLHRLPKPNFDIGSMRNFSRMKEAVKKRAAFAQKHDLEHQFTDLMLQLSDTFLEGTLPEGDFVFTHGDAHVGNAALRKIDGSPLWLDFESARLAPPEFDAATLYVNLTLLGDNAEAWNAAEAVLRRVRLQVDLMELFIRSRLISMTSYIMLFPERYSVARERLHLLAPLLDGGPLPDRFPDER